MESVSSRRSIVFYTGIVLAILILAIGILLITLFFNGNFNNDSKQDLSVVYGLALSILGIYLVNICIKKTYNIVINHHHLIINGNDLIIDDIKSINFTGKQKFSIFGKKEGAEITFNNGKTFYIYDNLYSNSAELKFFLENAWQKNMNTSKILYYDSDDNHKYNFYRGNIISLNFLVVFSLTVFVLFLTIIKPQPDKSSYFILLFPLALTTLCSGRFYYFGVGESFLRIKSFTYLWYDKKHRISDIKEIIFESNGKAPNSLSVILNNYTNKKYHASTLYDKDWIRIKKELESKDVVVRDELRLG